MMILKFTNVKYYRGGGKRPFRIRKNQNYSFHCPTRLTNTGHLRSSYDDLTDEQLKDKLYYWTEGRIVPSSTTKIQRIYR